jgi:hypothetical protein
MTGLASTLVTGAAETFAAAGTSAVDDGIEGCDEDGSEFGAFEWHPVRVRTRSRNIQARVTAPD